MPEAAADPHVAAAVARSRIGEISADVLAPVLGEGRRFRVPAGQTTHLQGESEAHVELVIDGLIRALVSAPDGRTLTIRYCRPGDLLGIATLFTDAGEERYTRLQAVKRRYDPGNVFRLNQNIPPG